MNKVLNTHWYGGRPDKLPAGVVYVGRPSPHGNIYGQDGSLLSRHQKVAYHLADLYKDITEVPLFFQKLKEDLQGRDLACWCKNEHTYKACHADNFLHVFDPVLEDRDYTRSFLFYLIDDIKRLFVDLELKVSEAIVLNHNKFDRDLEFALAETYVDIQYSVYVAKIRQDDRLAIGRLLAMFIVDLRYTLHAFSKETLVWLAQHILWVSHQYIYKDASFDEEPQLPDAPKLKKPRLKKEP